MRKIEGRARTLGQRLHFETAFSAVIAYTRISRVSRCVFNRKRSSRNAWSIGPASISVRAGPSAFADRL